jgi:hypothetical protein
MILFNKGTNSGAGIREETDMPKETSNGGKGKGTTNGGKGNSGSSGQ